jgi:hypothetical protein
MKYILYLFALCLLISCESFRVSKNQSYSESVEHPFEFNLLNNQIHCDVFNDSIKYDFMFDTGASRTLIFNDSLKQNSKLYGKASKIKLAYKNSASFSKATANLDYQFLNVDNKEIRLGKFPQSTKCDEVDLDGIIGGDLFNFYFTDTTKYIYSLSFSDSTITVYDTLTAIKTLNLYDSINSKFGPNHFSIYLTIDGCEKPLKCLFDTGFDYSLIIKDKKNLENISLKDSVCILRKLMFLETSKGKLLSKKQQEIDLFKTNININEIKINEGVIYSDLFFKNIVGMQFIKNFDWIIDVKHKQVYFKPNNVKHNMQNLYSLMYNLDFTLSVKDDKLYINQVNKNFTKYKLGAIIKSVNGTEVTPENVCELKTQAYASSTNVQFEFEGNFLDDEK